MNSEKQTYNEEKCNCKNLPKQPNTNHTLSCPFAPKCSKCKLPPIICSCNSTNFSNQEDTIWVWEKDLK